MTRNDGRVRDTLSASRRSNYPTTFEEEFCTTTLICLQAVVDFHWVLNDPVDVFSWQLKSPIWRLTPSTPTSLTRESTKAHGESMFVRRSRSRPLTGLQLLHYAMCLTAPRPWANLQLRKSTWSLAGRRVKDFTPGRRNPNDVRNTLPWEYLEFVASTAPKIVVIENVVQMARKFANDEEAPFVQLQQALRETALGMWFKV